MKKLTLVRHAKSDWGTDFLKDIDRPLNERGYRDAYLMSEWFKKNKTLPQLILSSSATRALSTALIFSRTFDKELSITINSKLYESTVANAKSIIAELDATVTHVMLFGHNPFITGLSNELSSELYFDNIPTCGLVEFEFSCNKWNEFNSNPIKQLFHQFPKQF
jgi:phosphohistidine phosphatase